MRSTTTALLLVLTFASTGRTDDTYRAEVKKWRADRETRLKADGGWLTVAGLFWLKEGENTFGSDAANDIVLPAGAPARAGSFAFGRGRTTVKLQPGVEGLVAGKPIARSELKSDEEGLPDVLAMGALTMQVIKRGE